MAERELWTAKRAEEEMNREGVIFYVGADGRRMYITYDENVNGMYAWEAGVECTSEQDFGYDEDQDGAFTAVANFLNALPSEVPNGIR